MNMLAWFVCSCCFKKTNPQTSKLSLNTAMLHSKSLFVTVAIAMSVFAFVSANPCVRLGLHEIESETKVEPSIECTDRHPRPTITGNT